jgi:hypothetical protein
VSADTEQPCDYWLRTPVENDGLRCWYRTKTGRPAIGYQGLVLGARPALRLDASRVLLLTRGPDAKNARLLKNGSELPLIPEAKSDELRLTLISDQLPQPEIANVSCNADVLTFDCACVGIGGIGGIGGNATVSALLTDASFEHALGYGRLMDAAKQSTATLSVRLPADFKLEGKKLWVFVETSDGGTSDNASKPILLYDGSTLQQSDGGSDETQD